MHQLARLTDEELVIQICDVDKELYREIVRRYERSLLRYAQYLIRDKDKAADAVQEAFIKAFVNLRGFDTKKKFSSWMYRITHNEAMSIVRKYHREVLLTEGGWTKYAGATDVEKEYEREETALFVKTHLAHLPIEYREPLALYYLEDKSYDEISDILKMPVGTVGTRINRAKKMMRENIKTI